MKQYRIGIIGCENSHANNFAKLMNCPDENGNLRYPDFHVTLAYGHYPEANQALVDNFGVDKVADSIEEMLDNVDAVMVTARDGKFHSEFVKPFLERGIPAFIDKPFTVDIDETLELIRIAKENNVAICGGSCLRFCETIAKMKKLVQDNNFDIYGGCVSAPVQVNSEYSGFFFYSSHLVEMTLEMFGYNPESITAVRHENGVCATINYGSFCVSNHFNELASDYSANVFTKKGPVLNEVTLEEIAQAGVVECDDFVNMVRTGEMSNEYDKFAIPVYYMNAVKKAYETGERVTVFPK